MTGYSTDGPQAVVNVNKPITTRLIERALC